MSLIRTCLLGRRVQNVLKNKKKLNISVNGRDHFNIIYSILQITSKRTSQNTLFQGSIMSTLNLNKRATKRTTDQSHL